MHDAHEHREHHERPPAEPQAPMHDHADHATAGGEHPEAPSLPAGGHEEHGDVHAGHSAELLRNRFWVSLVLAIPVIFYAESIQGWFNYAAPTFPGSALIPPIFSTVIFAYGGGVFLQGAWHELRMAMPGMMTLVSLAIVVAFGYSLATQVGLPGMPLYWELTTLIVVMLLGHWIEFRAIGRARGALTELAKLLPDTAERLVDGTLQEVPVSHLKPGDLVLVRPGSKVPTDGEVVDGESTLNEAMITGESRPVPKRLGEEVIGGTVNGAGSLRVRVTKVGEETALAGIMRIVSQAQESRSRAQALADRAAYWLVLIAIAAGSVTLLIWLLSPEPFAFALERTVTVLVVACPHALGLAIPLVISISTTLSARNGLLVRDRLALEQARNVDTIIFDKTGTLTHGEQGVVGVTTVDGLTEDSALAFAAAVEGDSEHPIARAIRDQAANRQVEVPAVRRFESLPGRGVQAEVDGRVIAVGGPRLLEATGIPLPEPLQEATTPWGAEGKTVVYVLMDGQPQAAVALADVIREESYEAIQNLKQMGLEVAMITGDSEEVAAWVARELGIDRYFAQVLPEHKARQVEVLQREGRRVAMVGDGVNDAPALVTADIGIAIGAGTDVAVESAGIILVRSDPRDVVRVVRLSQAGYRKMIQNLAWATGYNVVAIPLAAGILAPLGIILAPAIGALLMSASTVIVAINAQLLRRLDLASG